MLSPKNRDESDADAVGAPTTSRFGLIPFIYEDAKRRLGFWMQYMNNVVFVEILMSRVSAS